MQIKDWFSPPEPEKSDDLEGTMRTTSLVLSLAGFGLMVAGLVLMLLEGASFSSMEASALALFPVSAWLKAPVGLALTSAGIALLALLPIVRVVLALGLYLKERAGLNAAATLVVFLELLASILK